MTSAFSKIGAKVSKRSLQLHSTCPEQNRQSKNNSRKRFCFCELFQIRSKKFTAFRQKRLGSFDQNAFYVSIRTMWAGFFFEILYVHIYLRTSTEKVLEFHLKILPQQQSTFPEKCLEGNYSFWKCFFWNFFQSLSLKITEHCQNVLRKDRRNYFLSAQRNFWNNFFRKNITLGNFSDFEWKHYRLLSRVVSNRAVANAVDVSRAKLSGKIYF